MIWENTQAIHWISSIYIFSCWNFFDKHLKMYLKQTLIALFCFSFGLFSLLFCLIYWRCVANSALTWEFKWFSNLALYIFQKWKLRLDAVYGCSVFCWRVQSLWFFLFFFNQCYIIFFNIKIRLIITVNFWKSSGK